MEPSARESKSLPVLASDGARLGTPTRFLTELWLRPPSMSTPDIDDGELANDELLDASRADMREVEAVGEAIEPIHLEGTAAQTPTLVPFTNEQHSDGAEAIETPGPARKLRLFVSGCDEDSVSHGAPAVPAIDLALDGRHAVDNDSRSLLRVAARRPESSTTRSRSDHAFPSQVRTSRVWKVTVPRVQIRDPSALASVMRRCSEPHAWTLAKREAASAPTTVYSFDGAPVRLRSQASTRMRHMPSFLIDVVRPTTASPSLERQDDHAVVVVNAFVHGPLPIDAGHTVTQSDAQKEVRRS